MSRYDTVASPGNLSAALVPMDDCGTVGSYVNVKPGNDEVPAMGPLEKPDQVSVLGAGVGRRGGQGGCGGQGAGHANGCGHEIFFRSV